MYDSFSTDYDRFVNWQNRLTYEMPFIETQLQAITTEQSLKILDSACGTGMHAIALAKKGYSLAGADLSLPMIELAKKNAAIANVSVEFIAAGFGELERAFRSSILFPFDVLLCLGNSLPHLLSEQNLKQALIDFSKCLRPNGLLLIQNRNFDAVLANHSRWMEPQAHQEGDQEWIFQRFYDFEPDGTITFNIITLKRQHDSGWTQKISATRLLPMGQMMLQDALTNTGFTNIRAYGDMLGAAFDPQTSGNLIITANKSN